MVYKLIERSKGVVAFAISLMAFGTFGSFLLVLSISLISLRSIPEVQAAMPQQTLATPMFWVSSYVNLFIFLSWVVCGAGALHLRDWARQYLRVVMAAHVINMIFNIILNISMAQEVTNKVPLGFLFVGIAVSFSYYLGVIYFFSHPDIVRQFKYKSREY